MPPQEQFLVVQILSENCSKHANDEAIGAQAVLSTATSFSLAYQTTLIQPESPETAQPNGISSKPSNNNYLDKPQIQRTENVQIM